MFTLFYILVQAATPILFLIGAVGIIAVFIIGGLIEFLIGIGKEHKYAKRVSSNEKIEQKVNEKDKRCTDLKDEIWKYTLNEIQLTDYSSAYTYINAVDLACYEKFVANGTYTEEYYIETMKIIREQLKRYYDRKHLNIR